MRRTCSAYRDFSFFCASRKSKDCKEPDRTPIVVSKKLLPSPMLQPTTKLSPLSPLLVMSPSLKAKAGARSLLKGIVRNSKEPGKPEEKDILTLSKKETQPNNHITITINERGKEEEKKGGVDSFSQYISGLKRTPWIDKEKTNELILSPLVNTEGFRQKVPLGISNTEPSIEETTGVIFCACGKSCEPKSGGQCKACQEKMLAATYASYLYEKTEQKILDRHYYKLIGGQMFRKLEDLILT